MSLRAFRTLLAIAHHGTFARAGDAMGLTQSAVSLQVKSLEDEFGVQIFDRSRRQPILTEAGHILVTHAQNILTSYDKIPEALSEERSLVGHLRVGAVLTALMGPFPDALLDLRRAQPKLRVHIFAGLSAGLAERVASRDLDAAITSEPVGSHPRNLVWTPLYKDRFWALIPPGHEGKNLSDLLATLPFIRFDKQSWGGRKIDRELSRMKADVREEMALDSPEAIIRMVSRGLGMAILMLSDSMLANLPKNISVLPFGDPQLERTAVLLEHRTQTAHRFTQELYNAILRTINQPDTFNNTTSVT